MLMTNKFSVETDNDLEHYTVFVIFIYKKNGFTPYYLINFLTVSSKFLCEYFQTF